MGILDRVLRAGEGKKLKALEGIVPDIGALGDSIGSLSDDDLRHKTVEFRERLDRGETLDDAAARRLHEELGVNAELTFLYRFEDHAHFGDIGAEHELCSVYVAQSDTPVATNANEIAASQAVTPRMLDRELVDNPSLYTPWLKLEWPRIRTDHWDTVERMLAG